MKNMRYILFCAGILLAVACGKDKPATKPSIKIKSVSTDNLPVGEPLQMILEFTDKEGDISDSLYIKRLRLNTLDPQNGPIAGRLLDSFFVMVPEFPTKMKGEIIINLAYDNGVKDAIASQIIGGQPTPDSIQFRFALQDLAGHTSDTVTTKLIVVQRTD